MASRPVFLELWIGDAALSGVREVVLPAMRALLG